MLAGTLNSATAGFTPITPLIASIAPVIASFVQFLNLVGRLGRFLGEDTTRTVFYFSGTYKWYEWCIPIKAPYLTPNVAHNAE